MINKEDACIYKYSKFRLGKLTPDAVKILNVSGLFWVHVKRELIASFRDDVTAKSAHDMILRYLFKTNDGLFFPDQFNYLPVLLRIMERMNKKVSKRSRRMILEMMKNMAFGDVFTRSGGRRYRKPKKQFIDKSGMTFDEAIPFLDECLPSIYFKLGIRPHERDDVRQDCLVELWKSLKRFDATRGKLKPFLMQLCKCSAMRSKARDHYDLKMDIHAFLAIHKARKNGEEPDKKYSGLLALMDMARLDDLFSV